METVFQIAVDGPSGAGKSTVAKALAEKLNIDYIDTGAMYRAVALKILKAETDIYNQEALSSMLGATVVDFTGGRTYLDGEDVSDKIRSPEVTKMASDASAIPAVREKLVGLQQSMGRERSVVLDGRDIGTNVFPRARYKVFINASLDERARRRWNELKEKDQEADFLAIREHIRERDYNDSHRALNPLMKASDAVEIDTTDMTVNQVIDTVLELMDKQSAG